MSIVLSEDRCLYGPFLGHPMDPRTEPEDDDVMTPDEARSEAQDTLLRTSGTFADWISKQCDNAEGWAETDVDAIQSHDLIDVSTPTLVALLMAGSEMQSKRARWVLRGRYLKAYEREVITIAGELLKQYGPQPQQEEF